MTRTKTFEDFLAKPYGRLLVREPEGGFSAEVLEFPGCIAEGDTAEEAVSNVEFAARAWIDSELEQQRRIPEPISGGEYSGRLLVRLPRGLHRILALKAAADNTSLNQEVVAAVACWVGADDLYRRLTENRVLQSPAVASVVWGASMSGSWQGAQRDVTEALRGAPQSHHPELAALLASTSRR